jgi:hypothetical protein
MSITWENGVFPMLKKKMLQVTVDEEALAVDLTFHNLPANLLKEFALRVVKPYHSGSLTEAVKDLMEHAIADQEFVQKHIEQE